MVKLCAVLAIAVSLLFVPIANGQVQWTKSLTNPMISPAQAFGAYLYGFDHYHAWMPMVLFENGIYRMWYVGYGYTAQLYSPEWMIGYAISEDGKKWFMHRKNPVLMPGGPGSFDDNGIWGGTVIKDGGQYIMYYGARSASSTAMSIGYATSPDGIDWAKRPQPVLTSGASGSWDDNGVSAPSVVKEGPGQYRMWYTGATGSTVAMGYATSIDGINWTKNEANPVLSANPANQWESSLVTDGRVVKVGTMYHMLYHGAPGGGGYQIGYASSSDGITWSRYQGNPVVHLGQPGSWEDFTLSQHWFVWQDSTFKLWYGGRGSNEIFQIGYATSPLAATAVNVLLGAGWNMISNPVTVTDDTVCHLYPTSTFTYAYRFTPSGYTMDTTMENGIGYWERFPVSTSLLIAGEPRTRDSISVLPGWNIVGTISSTVDTGAIVSLPAGLRISAWFSYGESGYVPVTQLIPGQAYGVETSGAGRFVLSNSPLTRKARIQASGVNPGDVLNTLAISDSRGRSQKLYFGADVNNVIPHGLYNMPPLPPLGAFDARFETVHGGSMVQTHAAKISAPLEFPVTVQSDAYPLTVTWNINKGNASYELIDALGGRAFAAKPMNGAGSITITNSDWTRFSVRLVSDGQLPKEFALAQNYPNPFNPSTTITYDLPVDVRVCLKVFNVIGQEVMSLVNEDQKAGYKCIQFDGSSLASGTYFYRLQAGNFTSVKKLLLLK